jgi:hypothetical protein
MELMVWNGILSVALGLVGWFARTTWNELQRISILLNRTREEVAKEYVTKQEVHNDINRIVDRLEALDAKLDRIIESRFK